VAVYRKLIFGIRITLHYECTM